MNLALRIHVLLKIRVEIAWVGCFGFLPFWWLTAWTPANIRARAFRVIICKLGWMLIKLRSRSSGESWRSTEIRLNDDSLRQGLKRLSCRIGMKVERLLDCGLKSKD